MNKNQDLDNLLEDFLQENHVDDAGFSEQVMASMPNQPRLAWVTHVYPVFGILLGLFVIWKFDLVTVQKAAVWANKLMVFFSVHIGSVSATVSLSILIGVAALVGFFVTEKIKEM